MGEILLEIHDREQSSTQSYQFFASQASPKIYFRWDIQQKDSQPYPSGENTSLHQQLRHARVLVAILCFICALYSVIMQALLDTSLFPFQFTHWHFYLCPEENRYLSIFKIWLFLNLRVTDRGLVGMAGIYSVLLSDFPFSTNFCFLRQGQNPASVEICCGETQWHRHC